MRLFFSTVFFSVFILGCSQVELVKADSKMIHDHIASFRGQKAVLLNVWATTCAPCVEEFPMIVDLGKEIHDLEIVFVSADFDDKINEVIDFLNDHHVYRVSYIKNEKDQPFINGIHSTWTGSLPFTILFGKNSGEIVSYWEGKEQESKFRKHIQLAINE